MFCQGVFISVFISMVHSVFISVFISMVHSVFHFSFQWCIQFSFQVSFQWCIQFFHFSFQWCIQFSFQKKSNGAFSFHFSFRNASDPLITQSSMPCQERSTALLKHVDASTFVDGVKEQLTDDQVGMALYLATGLPPWHKLRELRAKNLGVLILVCMVMIGEGRSCINTSDVHSCL